jgi:hypothetical protein
MKISPSKSKRISRRSNKKKRIEAAISKKETKDQNTEVDCEKIEAESDFYDEMERKEKERKKTFKN